MYILVFGWYIHVQVCMYVQYIYVTLKEERCFFPQVFASRMSVEWSADTQKVSQHFQLIAQSGLNENENEKEKKIMFYKKTLASNFLSFPNGYY